MILGILFAIFLFLTGCQSTPPQYPKDHVWFERIVEAVEALRVAYEEKDSEALRELMLPVEVLKRLQREVRKDFNTYAEIALDFTIERIVIQSERIMVTVRWEGRWKQQIQKAVITRQGYGVLIWSGKQVILLVDMDGDLPFGMATREVLS